MHINASLSHADPGTQSLHYSDSVSAPSVTPLKAASASAGQTGLCASAAGRNSQPLAPTAPTRPGQLLTVGQARPYKQGAKKPLPETRAQSHSSLPFFSPSSKLVQQQNTEPGGLLNFWSLNVCDRICSGVTSPLGAWSSEKPFSLLPTDSKPVVHLLTLEPMVMDRT